MSIVLIFLLITLSTGLSIYEIPKMLKKKLYKELWIFSILLFSGTAMGILRSLNVTLPNPSDWIEWVYAPFASLLKDFLE